VHEVKGHWGFSRRKFSYSRSKAVETKNGVCNIIGINASKFLLMPETLVCV
jgi:hypothetical protein